MSSKTPIIEVTWVGPNGERMGEDRRTAIVRFAGSSLLVCTGATPEEAIANARKSAAELAHKLLNLDVR